MIDQIISLGDNKNVVTLELAGEIVDLVYPSQVEPNTPFDISYGAKNISTTTYTFFGYLEDEIGIVPGTEWQMIIGPNDTYYPVVVHPGIDQAITLTLTLGHIEEPYVSEFPWMWVIGGFVAVAAVAVTVYIVAKKPTPRKG